MQIPVKTIYWLKGAYQGRTLKRCAGLAGPGHAELLKSGRLVEGKVTLLPQTCRGRHQLHIPSQCQGIWA